MAERLTTTPTTSIVAVNFRYQKVAVASSQLPSPKRCRALRAPTVTHNRMPMEAVTLGMGMGMDMGMGMAALVVSTCYDGPRRL
ncbi:hypothetical protein E4U53_008101 [Claviceps sorghi]|nr:hypothetical protein E4U53_008101 [Claviceps sorghi]